MPEGQVPEGNQQGTQGSTNNTGNTGGQQQGGNTTPPGATGGATPPVQITGTSGQVPDGQGKTEKSFDETYVKKIRDEAAASRVELKELREKLKAIEEKDLSEGEKTSRRLKELEEQNTKLSQQHHSASVRAAAAALGCKKPDLIVKLIDTDVENVERAVAQIKKENPELFLSSTGSADGGAGNGSGTGSGKSTSQDMNFLIRSAAGRG